MNAHHHVALKWAVLVLLAAGGPLIAQIRGDQPGQYAEADIAYGARLYTLQCSMCHGPNGDSVGNVDLRSGRFRNAATDQQISGLITTGIPGTGMPAFKDRKSVV